MKYGDTLTPENLVLLTQSADGLMWLCSRCNEIFSPERMRKEFHIRPELDQATHFCKDGKRGALCKMSVKGYLTHYKFCHAERLAA